METENNLKSKTMTPIEPCCPGARKFDSNKPRWDLMPFRSLDLVAHIMTYGAKKYGDRNWESGTNHTFATRQIAAAYRHLQQHMIGNHFDAESGLRHLAHAATDILMALELHVLLTEQSFSEASLPLETDTHERQK